jgi:hypothetical protein
MREYALEVAGDSIEVGRAALMSNCQFRASCGLMVGCSKDGLNKPIQPAS